MNPVQQSLQRAQQNRAAAGITTDLERILAIPRQAPLLPEEEGLLVAEHSERWRWPRHERPQCQVCAGEGGRSLVPGTFEECPECYGDGRLNRPLHPGQAIALRDLQMATPPKGTVVGLRVGGGKTLVGMLAPLTIGGPRPQRPLALVPAPLVRQWGAMHADWSRDYRLPSLVDLPAVSHDLLSRPDSSALLEQLRPDLLVIDEAHAFRHMTSARTKRLCRYVVRNPHCRVVLMTGSLAADTLRDFAHLLELALREDAPIPLDDQLLAQWCAALDHRADPEASDWESIWPVVRAFSIKDPGGLGLIGEAPSGRIRLDDRERIARAAYGRRLRTTPGVVLSRGAICRASLRLRYWRPTPHPAIAGALRTLLDSWALPDGTELVDGFEVDRHRRTLSLGFYHRWAWPSCERCQGDGRVGYGPEPPEPCRACGGTGRVVDDSWMAARRNWRSAVRNALEYYARSGFDSPALIERAAREGRAGAALQQAWAPWAEVEHRPVPPTEVVWLGGAQGGARDWLVAALLTWKVDISSGRGLVWYHSSTALEGVLRDAGLPVHGSGSVLPSRDVDCAALSVDVHGTGADGLHYWWSENLILEPPSSGQKWEQLLGRTHRPGQKSPLVRADVFAPTWVGRAAMEEAIARTRFLMGPGGLDQYAKLAICDWETPLSREVLL